jgi:hypothetical protein
MNGAAILGNAADIDGGLDLRIVLIALIAAMLAGCGTYRWEKAGTTRADWQRESEECRQQPPAPSTSGTPPSADKQWENCMMGRGWRYSGSWF